MNLRRSAHIGARCAAGGVLGLLPLAGCASEPAGGAEEGAVLTVLAASSLTEVFEELAGTFEADHADVQVEFSFGSSATLAQQVVEGAPGDVLATADLTTMRTAEEGGGVTGPVTFATNRMVLVTPADDPGAVADLSDLARPGVAYLTCVESAPCGALAKVLLDRNGVEAEPVSQEPDVKAVLAKVAAGEADAGFVYATDAESAGAQVATVQVPRSGEELTSYAVAVTAQAEDTALAQDWVDLVTGDAGRSALADAGFGAAPDGG